MAIKKSELYSALWESCNELRGGMDASQYKDYVLVVLFMKYVSDKAKSDPDSLIELPEGCTFDDMVALQSKKNIGEGINKILERVAEANSDALANVITNADFCDESKLGKGDDLVKTVSELIGVFNNPKLDFRGNRASDDDLIGDAYEYLMKNFAKDSGKSKGQFYTPAEVSRLIAKLIGIHKDQRPQISIYDPTCGSGSLLLRARAEARNGVSINGQESQVSTIGMAKMNMILHGEEAADLRHGDTINDPMFYVTKDKELTQFDYVVANPPFSLKPWLKSAGEEDKYGRWGYDIVIGVPPEKCGDYAFLLHVIKSIKPDGRGACILPHGVLFRGGAEEKIRQYIVEHHYLKGIIGLPSNLFFGTGIPACILVIDKGAAKDSKGIFMINANEGFRKDGAKNRLREQDIKRIWDTWEKGLEEGVDVEHYARFVPYEEIEANGFNLNLPRYVTAVDREVRQDIEAHLHGGIPARDVEQMEDVWKACSTLKETLFCQGLNGYYDLLVRKEEIRETINKEESFVRQGEKFQAIFEAWRKHVTVMLECLTVGCDPKEVIEVMSRTLQEGIREERCLVSEYDAYDQVMNYWAETMQDDVYMISSDGWKVELRQPMDKKGNVKKSYNLFDLECDLLPVKVVVDNDKDYSFAFGMLIATGVAIDKFQQELDEFVEEHEEDFSELEKINAANVKKAMKTCTDTDLRKVYWKYIHLDERVKSEKQKQKNQNADLILKVISKYRELNEAEIKELVVKNKWMKDIEERLNDEMNALEQQISDRVLAVEERYETTLGETAGRVSDLEKSVLESLKEMGYNI